jgi:PKD repeat protein/DNA-binding transcriptional ArsR family regulator
VVIDEVLFAPAPGGHQKVALYNAAASSVSLDGWILSDEDGYEYVLPGIPDVPPGARVWVHLRNGSDETSFGESEPRALHLYFDAPGFLEATDQLSLYRGAPTTVNTIEDFVSWQEGSPPVACAPVLLSRAGEAFADQAPALAGFGGTPYAVWTTADPGISTGTDADIVARPFGPAPLGPVEELNTPGDATRQSGDATLVEYGGRLYALWTDPGANAADPDRLNYSAHDGVRWSPEQVLAVGTANASYTAPAAAAYAGGLLVAWRRTEYGTNYADDILYRRLEDGLWSPPEFLSGSGDPYLDRDPAMAVHGGLLFTFWVRYDPAGAGSGIVYRTFDGAVWSPVTAAVPLASGGSPTEQLVAPRAASFDGELHLVWSAYRTDPNGTGPAVFHTSLGDLGWAPVADLSAPPAGGVQYDTDPAIAVGPDGLDVVWSSYTRDVGSNTTGYHLQLRTLADGAWSDVVTLTSGDGSDFEPAIASAGSAVFVVWTTYQSTLGGDGDIQACRLEPAASLGDDAMAVAAGIWPPGASVPTAGLSSNLTIHRVAPGLDTDDPSDWSFQDRDPPVARAGADQAILEDSKVLLNGAGSYDNVAIVEYLWDADAADGLAWSSPDEVGAIADWVYADPGVYRATLRVRDAEGNVATDEVVITVSPSANAPPAVTAFNAPTNASYRRDPVPLAANGTDDTTPPQLLTAEFEWRAPGQLGWSADYVVTTGYSGGFHQAVLTPGAAAPLGLYSLRARLGDENGSFSAWAVLPDHLAILSDLPTADAGPDLATPEDQPLALSGQGSTDNRPLALFTWDFGDGSSSSSANATTLHTWSQPGTYTVTLTVADSDGNRDADTALVTVADGTRPQAAIQAPSYADEDILVRFSAATSSDNVGIVSYAWDFGDGATANTTSPEASHAFDAGGQYLVQVRVLDAAGNAGVAYHAVFITDLITVNDDGGEDFTRIQDAIDDGNTTAGARIYVHSGVYPEDVVARKSVVLIGADADTVTVVGNLTTLSVTADGVRASGFTFRGGPAATCVSLDAADRFSLQGSRIEDCAIGVHVSRATSTSLLGNVLARGDYGILAEGVDDDTYRYNEISGYGVAGVELRGARLAGGVAWNRFHHNAVGYAHVRTGPAATLDFAGNDLWENGVALRVADGDSIRVADNTFQDNGAAVQLQNASPEVTGNRFVGTGAALECNRSAADVHANDFTAMPVVRLSCSRADGLRFAGNELATADFTFAESTLAALEVPAGTTDFLSSPTDPGLVTLGERAEATYRWWLVVLVVNRTGAPVAGAAVYVRDATATAVANAVTGADGRTPPMRLLTQRQLAATRGGVSPQGPFNITAELAGHAASRALEVAADTEATLALPTYPPIPAVPVPTAFPAWAMATIAALLFAGGIGAGGVGSSEVGRWSLWLLFLPLYTRLRKEDITEQPTRQKILGFVLGSPGAHFALIGQRLGLAHGQLAYHLDVLTKEGFIFARSDGFKKRFYPADTPPDQVQDFVLSDIQERVLEMVAVNPGIGQKAISVALGSTRQVVSYHLERLEKFSKVRRVGDGRNAQYYVKDDGKGWVSSAPPANGQV